MPKILESRLSRSLIAICLTLALCPRAALGQPRAAAAARLEAATEALRRNGFDPGSKATFPIAAPALGPAPRLEIEKALGDLETLLKESLAKDELAKAGVAFALAALCVDRPDLVVPLFEVRDYAARLDDEEDFLLLIAAARLGRTQDMAKVRIEDYFGSTRGGETLVLSGEQEEALAFEANLGVLSAEIKKEPSAERLKTRGLAYLHRAGVDLQEIGRLAWEPRNRSAEEKRDVELAGKDFRGARELGMGDADDLLIGEMFYHLGIGNVETAGRIVEKILHDNPQSAVAWFLFAIYLYEMGIPFKAREAIRTIESAGIAVDPGFKAAIEAEL